MNKRLDKIGKITNILLIIIYFPLMFFGMLAGVMSTEVILSEHTKLQAVISHTASFLGYIGPVAVIVCMLLSARFRNTGKSVQSFVIQFLPLLLYSILCLLLWLI